LTKKYKSSSFGVVVSLEKDFRPRLSALPHFAPAGFFLPMPRQTKVKPESQGSRLCTSCNKVKVLSQFEHFKDGQVRGVCRHCVTLQRSKKTSATPESYIRVLNTQLKSQRLKQGVQYDLTNEEVIDLWNAQNGKCALFWRPHDASKRWNVWRQETKRIQRLDRPYKSPRPLRTGKRTVSRGSGKYHETHVRSGHVHVVDKEHSRVF
jgi:hypothetical protein